MADKNTKAAENIVGDTRDAIESEYANDTGARADMLIELGQNLAELGVYAKAQETLEQAVHVKQETDPSHWQNSLLQITIGYCLLEQDKAAKAKNYLENGYAGFRKRMNDTPVSKSDRKKLTLRAIDLLVQVSESTGDSEAKSKWSEEREKVLLMFKD